MRPLDRFLTFSGIFSTSIGAILGLVALFKGREARQLQGVTYVENLSELKHLLSLVPLVIAVTGRVWAPRPLKCDLSEGEGVIVELREDKKSETRSASIWLADSEPLREVVRENTEWGLADGSGPFMVQLPIVDGRRAAGDYMQMSGDVFIPAQEGLVEQVLGQLAGHKSLGVRRSERFLPVNTAITAVGELTAAVDHPSAFKGAFRESGKMYVLRKPRKGPFLLSRQRLPDIIASAQATSVVCAELAAWFTAAGASMLLIVVSRKAWIWRQEQKMRKRVEDARRRQRSSGASGGNNAQTGTSGQGEGNDNSEEMSAGMCVVCLERGSERVYPNCGHMCVCSECAGRGTALDRCPICRSRGAPIRVFRT